jgi:hypothetical protein
MKLDLVLATGGGLVLEDLELEEILSEAARRMPQQRNEDCDERSHGEEDASRNRDQNDTWRATRADRGMAAWKWMSSTGSGSLRRRDSKK